MKWAIKMCSYSLASAFQWPFESFVGFKRLLSFHSQYTCFVWLLKALLSSLQNCWKHLRPPNSPRIFHILKDLLLESEVKERSDGGTKLEKESITKLEAYYWQMIRYLHYERMESWASFLGNMGEALLSLTAGKVSLLHVFFNGAGEGKRLCINQCSGKHPRKLHIYLIIIATSSASHGENELCFSTCL